MPRSHDKEHFFKYMTCETAEAVLQSSTLRWTKPSNFNDPFDHQVSFRFPFNKEELSHELSRKIEYLVYEAEIVQFVEETQLSKMVMMLRQYKNTIPKQKVLETLRRGCVESAEKFQSYQEKINSLIGKELNQSRVLCVTESNKNVVMWSHYADSHKGVCLRLECVDAVDTALLAAKPIKYTDSFPLFMDLEQHIKYLTGQHPAQVGKLLTNIAYLKHLDWAYENEWRLHRPHEDDKGEYNDWVEDISVFGGIYLGCRIDPNNVTSLMRIIEEKYPHMDVFQSRVSNLGFDIEYEQIK